MLDLGQIGSLEVVTQQISHLIQRGVPVRFGVVPMFDSSNNDICECASQSKTADARSTADGSGVLLQHQDLRSSQNTEAFL